MCSWKCPGITAPCLLPWKWKSLSHFWLFATPWTVAHRAPPSMGFSRREYWSGLPFSSPGGLPAQELNPSVLHCRQILYRLSYQGSPSSLKATPKQWLIRVGGWIPQSPLLSGGTVLRRALNGSLNLPTGLNLVQPLCWFSSLPWLNPLSMFPGITSLINSFICAKILSSE